MRFATAGLADGLRGALATVDLRRLQLASAVACTGGWAFMVGLSVYAYEVGGAAAVGLAALVRMLPAGLAAPLAGVVADRRSRRDVLAASCLGRGGVLAAIAGAVAVHAPFAGVLVLAGIVTVLQSAQRPAQAALLPALARTPSELGAANAAWSGLDNVSFLLGALLGGALIAATGPTVVFAVTAGLFAFAAAALLRIERDAPAARDRAEPATTTATVAALGGELADGLRAVRAEPALALVIGVVAVTTFVEGVVDVLVIVSALTILHLGDAGAGWLNAAWGAGGLAGGAAALVLVHRGRVAAGLAGGALLAGLALMALAALPLPAAGLALMFVFGTGYALIDIAELTLVQRLAGDALLARAFSVTETLYWLTTGLGAAFAPLLVVWLGTRGALAVAGGSLVILVAARAHPLARLRDVPATPPVLVMPGVERLRSGP